MRYALVTATSFDRAGGSGVSLAIKSPVTDDLCNELGAIVVELDGGGLVRRIGAFGASRLGYQPEELMGADWFERLVPREERADRRRAFLAWMEAPPGDGPPSEINLLTRRGDTLRVAWRSRPVGPPGERRALSVGLELGDAFSTSAEYQRTARALRDVRDALDASTIVAITDRGGVITFVNDRFCAVSQYTREDLIGKTHRVVSSGLHPPEFFAQMWGTITRGEVWRGDVANRAKDGSIYWVATTIVPFLDNDARPYQYCAIRTEITERKRIEAELIAANRRVREEQANLIHAEKLSSIGVLAAGVAHEINNPLAGVMACVTALREQTMSEARRTEYFETVIDGLERIQTTVRGLLDYARQRGPQPVAVAVSEVIEAVILLVTPALRKKDLQVVIRGARDPRATVDRAQLMQALVNVLLNAVFASPPGAEITVDLSHADDGVRLAIVDDGPGFAPETLPRVCDPFFTTKPEGEGTGLGLAVTSSLIAGNRGRLELGNAPERGAQVVIWLPGAAPPPDTARR